MKTLILLRHAKSEDPGLLDTDFKRHLKERGKKDIRKVAESFKQLKCIPDIILCSTAVRTRETLEEFNKVYNNDIETHYLHELYHASASQILDIIYKYPVDTMLVIGHNNGISVLADALSESSCMSLPTSGMVVLEFEKLIETRQGKLAHFIIPDKN